MTTTPDITYLSIRRALREVLPAAKELVAAAVRSGQPLDLDDDEVLGDLVLRAGGQRVLADLVERDPAAARYLADLTLTGVIEEALDQQIEAGQLILGADGRLRLPPALA